MDLLTPESSKPKLSAHKGKDSRSSPKNEDIYVRHVRFTPVPAALCTSHKPAPGLPPRGDFATYISNRAEPWVFQYGKTVVERLYT